MSIWGAYDKLIKLPTGRTARGYVFFFEKRSLFYACTFNKKGENFINRVL